MTAPSADPAPPVSPRLGPNQRAILRALLRGGTDHHRTLATRVPAIRWERVLDALWGLERRNLVRCAWYGPRRADTCTALTDEGRAIAEAIGDSGPSCQ